MKKEVRLYNAMFPLWFILFASPLLAPWIWLACAVGNFIIDSAVVLIVIAVSRLEAKRKFYWSSIWKVFLLGFLADFIGAGLMLILGMFVRLGSSGDELYLTLPGLIFTAALIFVFNYFISFRRQKRLRLRFSLTLAIATAPYTFLIPTAWLYNH